MRPPVPLKAPMSSVSRTPALAATVLERARGAGLPAVGGAIQDAEGLTGALSGLQRLGVMLPGEADLASDRGTEQFRALLERIWYDAAPHTPRRFELDRSWPVPAVVARRDGVSYYFHGLFPHPGNPSLVPPQLHSVRRLVARLQKPRGQERGLPLYSEYRLPKVYGYSSGREFVDVNPEGQELGFAFLRDAQAKGGSLLSSLQKFGWSAFTLSFAAAWAAIHPGSDWGVPMIGLAVAYNYLFWRSWLPLRRFVKFWQAAVGPEFDRLNRVRWARAVLTSRPDPDMFRRVTLPWPNSEFDPLTAYPQRARLQAELAAREAKLRGLDELHILTGANHGEEGAWHVTR